MEQMHHRERLWFPYSLRDLRESVCARASRSGFGGAAEPQMTQEYTRNLNFRDTYTLSSHGLSIVAVKTAYLTEKRGCVCVKADRERRAGGGLLKARGAEREREAETERGGKGGGIGQPLPFRITLPAVLSSLIPPAACRFGFGAKNLEYKARKHPSFHPPIYPQEEREQRRQHPRPPSRCARLPGPLLPRGR